MFVRDHADMWVVIEVESFTTIDEIARHLREGCSILGRWSPTTMGSPGHDHHDGRREPTSGDRATILMVPANHHDGHARCS